MAKIKRKSTNRGLVLIAELAIIFTGILFIWSVIVPIICLIVLMLCRYAINYEYSCSECGGKVGKNTVKCYKCGAILKKEKINLTGRQNRYY